MNYEERRQKMVEKDRQKKEKEEMTTKEFNFRSSVEDAKLKIQTKYNTMDFSIFRKSYNQVKGKEVSFGLSKEEATDLKNYIEEALKNWDEWNKQD